MSLFIRWSIFLVPALLSGAKLAMAAESSEAQYARLFPNSAEVCGLTSIHKNPNIGMPIEGGSFGHMTLWIRGACHDRSSPYPKIKVCEAGKDHANGVGISVDADFRNANWVAIEDRNFMYYGMQQSGTRLDLASFNRTVESAKAFGFLAGVTYQDAANKTAPADLSREDFVYQSAYGTDFAINDGRNMYCAQVPLDAWQVGKMVENLNERNRQARYVKDYTWSQTDTCATTVLNALANAGVIRPYHVGGSPALHFSDLGIPMNAYVDVMKRVNDLELEDIRGLYNDPVTRKLMNEDGILTTQAGGITSYAPVHTPNDIFKFPSEGQQWDPFHEDKSLEQKYFTEPRYTDLKTNLEFFLDRIQKIKAHSKPTDGSGDVEYTAFVDKYYAFLDRQLEQTRQRLELLK